METLLSGILFTIVFYLVFPMIVVSAFCKMAGINSQRILSGYTSILMGIVGVITQAVVTTLFLSIGFFLKNIRTVYELIGVACNKAGTRLKQDKYFNDVFVEVIDPNEKEEKEKINHDNSKYDDIPEPEIVR